MNIELILHDCSREANTSKKIKSEMDINTREDAKSQQELRTQDKESAICLMSSIATEIHKQIKTKGRSN